MFMRNAAVYQGPPNGFGDVTGKSLAVRGGQHLGDHVLDPPFKADLALVVLNPGRRLDIALTLGDQPDERPVQPVDFRPHLFHGPAVIGADRHQVVR